MQSQLIQFFDIKSTIAVNRLNHTVNANRTTGYDFRSTDEFTLNSTRLNDTETENLVIQNNNATVDGIIETGTASTTPITIDEEQRMPNSGRHATRKRKRTANTVYIYVVLLS